LWKKVWGGDKQLGRNYGETSLYRFFQFLFDERNDDNLDLSLPPQADFFGGGAGQVDEVE